MKRFLLIAALAISTLIISCDRQKALDRIMGDPQMRSYLLQQMLADQKSRAEMADSILNDNMITDAYLKGLVANELSREALLQKIIAVDPTGAWTVGRLSENPEIMKELKKASKK